MKKFIISNIILLSFFALVRNSYSQIQFFDSVKTVVSSTEYDYKNPAFGVRINTIGDFCWLVYERHSVTSSDIIVRKARYSSFDNEIIITNTNSALNINPSIDPGMIVWQSNARGNWDLHYSVLIGDSWSAPQLIDSSSSDETDPFITNNNKTPVENNFFYLTYKQDNSIRFRKYKTSTGIWNNDTLVSEGPNDHITPLISRGNFGNQLGVIFLKKYPGGITKINHRLFYENYSGGAVGWENVFEFMQPNPQTNLSYCYANSDFLTYSYDTLNSTHNLIFMLTGQDYKGVVTKNVPGKHFLGKGSWMSFITDETYFHFSAYSVLSRFSDSLCFTFINRPGSFNNNPQFKKLYLGDTNLIVKFDVSQPIFNQSYFYRIKTVWEKNSSGRTELVESYMTDNLSEIENNNLNAGEFYLKQNYPNPFNPVTVIRYSLSENRFVTLKVYDVRGNEIATLVNEKQNSGTYSYQFSTVNYQLSSGLYFYKFEAGDFTETKRMILLK